MKGIVWDLSDCVKNEKDFLERVKELEKVVPKLTKIFKSLSPSMSLKKFKDLINYQEEIGEEFSKLSAYIGLLGATDTKNQTIMRLQPKLENVSIKISDADREIQHWIQGLKVEGKERLDDHNAHRLFKSCPQHEHNLHYSRKVAKHTLPSIVEQVIHRKDINGVETVVELYEKLTTNFSYDLELPGKKPKKIINQEELKRYIHNSNKEIRAKAYEALFVPYKCNKEIIFTMYSSVVKDWVIEQKLRKYASPINVKNVGNQLDDQVIDTLLKVVQKNRKVYQVYFKIKAKSLGLKKLSRTDLYAPTKKVTKKYSFSEAKKMVQEVYTKFHPDFSKKAELLYKHNHIDSHPKENKRSGAFCLSVGGDVVPYVMLNFVGTQRDVSTIAHELGHAIHNLYTKELPHSVAHSSIPLAETASTFGEMLLFEELLKGATKEERRTLIMDKIADSYAAIMRQAYFTLFEIEAHDKIPQGVTEEELSKLWLDGLKEQFGPSVDIPEYFKYEWAYIPHIFDYPFYCYAYTFGELLSLALYAQYKKEGQLFIPKLERILAAGGSLDTATILKKEGFDITKASFWEDGFSIINGWVKELEKSA